MADVKGRDGVLSVSSAGSSYTAVGGVTDFTMSTARGTIEVTDFDSSGWKESLCGIGTVTIDCTMNYDEDDAGQDIIWTNISTPQAIYFQWQPRGTTVPYVEYVLKCNITSLDETQSFDGAAELTLSAELTAAPTIQAQS